MRACKKTEPRLGYRACQSIGICIVTAHAHTRTHTYVHTHARTHADTCAHARTRTYAHAHTHTHSHTHGCTHSTHIHTAHTHAHTLTCTNADRTSKTERIGLSHSTSSHAPHARALFHARGCARSRRGGPCSHWPRQDPWLHAACRGAAAEGAEGSRGSGDAKVRPLAQCHMHGAYS